MTKEQREQLAALFVEILSGGMDHVEACIFIDDLLNVVEEILV